MAAVGDPHLRAVEDSRHRRACAPGPHARRVRPGSGSVRPSSRSPRPTPCSGSHSCFWASEPSVRIANIASDPARRPGCGPESPLRAPGRPAPYAVGARAGAAVALQVHAQQAEVASSWPARARELAYSTTARLGQDAVAYAVAHGSRSTLLVAEQVSSPGRRTSRLGSDADRGRGHRVRPRRAPRARARLVDQVNTTEAVGERSPRWECATRGRLSSGDFIAGAGPAHHGHTFHHAVRGSRTMSIADGYARVEQPGSAYPASIGPWLTNTLTGLTRRPRAAPADRARRRDAARGDPLELPIDQEASAAKLGAVPERVHWAATAAADATRRCAARRSNAHRSFSTLPLDVAGARRRRRRGPGLLPQTSAPAPAPEAVRRRGRADRAAAQRPVIVAERQAPF